MNAPTQRVALPRRDVFVHFLVPRDPGGQTQRAETGLWLRGILGSLLGVAPSELRFTRRCGRCGRDHGRPELAGPYRGAATFNLSYTRGVSVIAVTDGTRIGVDVEAVRRASFLRDVLTAGELARVGDRPTDRQLISAWVRKEALAKVSGLGLYLSPRGLTVDSPTSTSSVRADDGRILTCGLAELDTPPGVLGAVALHGAMPNVVTSWTGTRVA